MFRNIYSVLRQSVTDDRVAKNKTMSLLERGDSFPEVSRIDLLTWMATNRIPIQFATCALCSFSPGSNSMILCFITLSTFPLRQQLISQDNTRD